MSHRKIIGLRTARLIRAEDAPFKPTRRRKGAKAAGLRFERALAKALPLALHGQWFEYHDSAGRGFAQTDCLIVWPSEIVVIEAKLSDAEGARAQMRELYRPILSHIFARPIREIIVLRHLTAEPRLDLIRTTLWEALELARILAVAPCLHWREGHPIGLAQSAGHIRPAPSAVA